MILIADDNQADARLIIEAFRENGLKEECEVACDGEQCMKKLRDGPLPRLLVLDLNMPKMNGLQVLREIKSDPKLRLVPVVVLTTSDADRDIMESYELYANSYITKPLDMADFIEVMRKMYEYWFAVGKLPKIIED